MLLMFNKKKKFYLDALVFIQTLIHMGPFSTTFGTMPGNTFNMETSCSTLGACLHAFIEKLIAEAFL